MSREPYQLSFSQFVFLIYKTQIGIGVTTLPRDVGEKAGADAWISVLISCLVSIAAGIVIVKIMERHPQDTLYDLLPKIFGKWIGKGMVFIWVILFFFKAGAVFFVILYIIQTWVLPFTPAYLIAGLFLIPTVMTVRLGMKGIGRFADFIYLFSIWMGPFLVLALQEHVEWLNLLPVLREGWLPVLEGVRPTLLSFLGFEVVFILYPFLKHKKEAVKGVVVANVLTLFIYLQVVVFSFVRFSPEEIHSFFWPTFVLLKPIRLPFLERLEIVFISFYLFVLLFTVMAYLYMALYGAIRIGGKQDHRPLLWVTALVGVVVFVFVEPSDIVVIQLQRWLTDVGIVFAFVLPPVLWFIGRVVTGKKKEVAT
ncbi:GerAB/ArcD/ProY family transporter [Desmospora profundinema]|uniref:Spore germination protein (Amino acid permease) n=1 Tax=Desmospora profundinema TaxID=1571184 RepID=A0ABU1IRG4_9BACL|nr:endospore germination permease [Desmospora profundinema]MDR6227340.1 spore germination protein (amino acid permease) [Desmospora profundinema]